MAIIVYAIDYKEKTIEFFSDPVLALKHKATLESYGDEVAYVDIPSVTVDQAEKLYEVLV